MLGRGNLFRRLTAADPRQQRATVRYKRTCDPTTARVHAIGHVYNVGRNIDSASCYNCPSPMLDLRPAVHRTNVPCARVRASVSGAVGVKSTIRCSNTSALTHLESLSELHNHTLVNLAADDLLGFLQEKLCHDSRTWSNFKHNVRGTDTCFRDDCPGDGHILQKVLPSATRGTGGVCTTKYLGPSLFSLFFRHGWFVLFATGTCLKKIFVTACNSSTVVQ